MNPAAELGWRYHGQGIMERYGGPPGTRPWGFWTFELGEEMPSPNDAQARRLAELGELSAEEVAAFREQANEAKLRIGTERELISDGRSVDRRSVELYERLVDAQSLSRRG